MVMGPHLVLPIGKGGKIYRKFQIYRPFWISVFVLNHSPIAEISTSCAVTHRPRDLLTVAKEKTFFVLSCVDNKWTLST